VSKLGAQFLYTFVAFLFVLLQPWVSSHSLPSRLAVPGALRSAAAGTLAGVAAVVASLNSFQPHLQQQQQQIQHEILMQQQQQRSQQLQR
jgi:hypothetical protein